MILSLLKLLVHIYVVTHVLKAWTVISFEIESLKSIELVHKHTFQWDSSFGKGCFAAF